MLMERLAHFKNRCYRYSLLPQAPRAAAMPQRLKPRHAMLPAPFMRGATLKIPAHTAKFLFIYDVAAHATFVTAKAQFLQQFQSARAPCKFPSKILRASYI